MHRKTAAMIVSMLVLPGIANAQDRGSEQDQEACTPDVFRLCSDFIPNEGPILTCLQANRGQLSPACGVVIFPPPSGARSADAGTSSRAQTLAGHSKHRKKHRHPADR